MNVICILLDSLNRHFLPAYGSRLANTPNLDRLARRSAVFDRNFIGSAPCMPARRDLWTGNQEFLWRPWGSLEPWDCPLPRVLRGSGVVTQLITDHYHLFEEGGENYHTDFDGWEFIRGHENDPWVTQPSPKPDHLEILTDRYARNMTRLRREADFFAPRTMTAAAQWLEENCRQPAPWFLMIDEFDPHEPFHVPPPYDTMYDDQWRGPLLFWPRYGRRDFTEDQARHVRALYAGKVTMVDHWLGRVLDQLDKFELWDSTAVILMTDHGHFLGEHGWWGKPACPPYNTIAHTPLMIHLPGDTGAGRRIDALTTTVDLYTTILDCFGLQPPAPVQGRSLLPLLRGEAQAVRDHVLYGWFGQWVGWTDGRLTYLRAPRGSNTPLAVYSQRWSTAPWWRLPKPESVRMQWGAFIPGVPYAVGRMELSPSEMAPLSCDPGAVCGDDFLFDLETDPDQRNNLASTPLAETCADKLRAALKADGAPPEQFARLGL